MSVAIDGHKSTANFEVSSFSAYRSPMEHLSDELRLLDLRLQKELCRKMKLQASTGSETAGLFVAAEEIYSTLSSGADDNENKKDHSEIDDLDQMIGTLEKEISIRLSNTKESGIIFPLMRLSEIFGLTQFEQSVIIAALAPDLDKKYERTYAYFNDDLNKKAPSIDMLFNIFLSDPEEKMDTRKSFSEQAALFRFNLLNFVTNHDEEGFLSSRLKIDSGIKTFLLGDSSFHSKICDLAEITYPEQIPFRSSALQHIKAELENALTAWMKGDTKSTVIWLYGKAENEKNTIMQSLCSDLEFPVILVDLEEIAASDNPKRNLKLVFREAVLKSALLLLSSGDKLCGNDENSCLLRRLFFKSLTEYAWIAFICAEKMWVPDSLDERSNWFPVEVKLPDYEGRQRIWSDALKEMNVSSSDIDALSGRYNFNESHIRKVAAYAKIIGRDNAITLDVLSNSCKILSTQQLSKYTKKITPNYSWDDLVLPKDKLCHLKEMCGFIKNKHIVYYEWGFDKKLALGRGLNMLFSGSSGTGKTMTADIIASELQLELYKTDLSSLVSKYIGETEKNLNRIFKETSFGNAILFFDEADALFGKRSEVKDAHDRYANMETNYLLQKIEEHEGVVILATNFSQNIDEAFLRRMHFSVDFPFPTDEMREQMWKKIFPADAPLSGEIDYKYLSETIMVAGGNIRNLALSSAYFAADESSGIGMRHIMHAAKREYQKLGKPFLKTDFEKYWDLLEQ